MQIVFFVLHRFPHILKAIFAKTYTANHDWWRCIQYSSLKSLCSSLLKVVSCSWTINYTPDILTAGIAGVKSPGVHPVSRRWSLSVDLDSPAPDFPDSDDVAVEGVKRSGVQPYSPAVDLSDSGDAIV